MSRASRTVIQPDLWTRGPWVRVTKGHPAAVQLADRHYSRGTIGGQVGPPGRLLVFVTADGRALWVSHWPNPELALDGLNSWRCSAFRREPGAPLASELVREAMLETARIWTNRPTDGWMTWIDRAKVESNNPGYCFKMAGWWWDRGWKPAHPKPGTDLIRLRADILEPS